MSLQRRLLIYLLVSGPLVWALAMAISVNRARHEVNELYDTEMIRLARQVQATLVASVQVAALGMADAGRIAGAGSAGGADVRDMATAIWNRAGRLILSDREGALLPRLADRSGFVNLELEQRPWRVYYLQSADNSWLVAAGQRADERDELVMALTWSHLGSWLLMLPLLIGAMVWAVRRAMAPVRILTRDLQGRSADELAALPEAQAPAELRPMVAAINGLFARIDDTLARERRFTADAAHEIRTPLAVLRAQWDVLRRSAGSEERQAAERKLAAGFERMDRLVTQMLQLSRLENASLPPAAGFAVDWQTVVTDALSDCLGLCERRSIELDCEWPASDAPALPLRGDRQLVTAMLRNLVDNAARYSPQGGTVSLRFTESTLEVCNDCAPIDPAQRRRLGERFFRPDGQEEGGSGLGLSIVQRVAALHGLRVEFGALDGDCGMRVRVTRAAA